MKESATCESYMVVLSANLLDLFGFSVYTFFDLERAREAERRFMHSMVRFEDTALGKRERVWPERLPIRSPIV
jgi:hypothetical protein